MRHSFVPSIISNDSNTQYSYNVFDLIAGKKITESKCLIADKEQGCCLLFQEKV